MHDSALGQFVLHVQYAIACDNFRRNFTDLSRLCSRQFEILKAESGAEHLHLYIIL